MVSVAPVYSLTEIRAKQGDEVTVIITNRDSVEDLCHGFCVSHHDVSIGVAPQETVSVTFEVPNKGVFWYYCPWFCHALHLEMRGRLIVS
jgi:nitrous-oxide reductase